MFVAAIVVQAEHQVSTEPTRIDDVAELLEGVVGGGVRVGGVAALPGISHRSFRVETNRGVFVVKLRAAGAAQVLGVEDEYRVHARAAAAGVAPEAVGFDVGRGALVTRFVDGARTLSIERMRAPGSIAGLARLLDALHAVEHGDVGAFTAEMHARRYVDVARRQRVLDAEDGRLADELLALAYWFDGLGGTPVLCHTDLVASNVLCSGRLWLIDFEYAATADPVLDLASLAAMNRYTAAECRELIDAYASAAARPWAAADFDRVMRLLALLAYFWADAEAARAGPREGLEAFRRRDELLNDRNS